MARGPHECAVISEAATVPAVTTWGDLSNGIGRLSAINDQSGRTAYEYDARGNVVATIHTIGAHSYRSTYTYNSADRLTGMSYPSGREIAYTLDASGRIESISATDPDGTHENLASDIERLPFGPLTGLTLGNGVQRDLQFDQDYRLQSLQDTGVLSRGYAWNAVNTITAITDALHPGTSQLFQHGALDRLTFATGAYGDQSFTYDGIGNRLSRELADDDGNNARTQTYSYASDSHHLLSITGPVGTSFQHDAAGNTLVDGVQRYGYNQRGRLATSTAGGETTTYRHNALGQRVEKRAADGSATHFIYSLAGQLMAEADEDGDVLVEYAWLGGEPLAQWRDEAPDTGGSDGGGDPDGGNGGDTTPTTTFRLEVEDYISGANGVAYYDTDAGNNGFAYRDDDVDIETTADTGGGFNVGWIADGEWLTYALDVPALCVNLNLDTTRLG